MKICTEIQNKFSEI